MGGIVRHKASSSFSERFISKKHNAKGKTRISNVFTRPLHVCTLCKQHTHRESHTLGTGSSFTGSVNSGLKLRSGNPSCHHLSRTEYFSPCIFFFTPKQDRHAFRYLLECFLPVLLGMQDAQMLLPSSQGTFTTARPQSLFPSLLNKLGHFPKETHFSDCPEAPCPLEPLESCFPLSEASPCITKL